MKRQLVKGLFVFSLLIVLLTIIEPNPDLVTRTNTTETTVISSNRAPGDYSYDYPMRNSNFTNQNMSIPSPYAPQYWKYQEPGGDPYSILTGGWDDKIHGQGTSYIRLYYGTTSRNSYGEWYQDFSYDATANANVTAMLSVRWRCDTFTNAGTNNTMSVWLKNANGTTFRLDYWPVTSTSNWALKSYNVTNNVKNGNGVFRVTLRYYGGTRSGYTTTVRVWWDDCAIAFKYNPQYPPSGLGLVLNGAANFTNTIQVSARLLGFGISEYCLSNNHTQGTWTTLSSPTVPWNLNGTEGNLIVFFWARNAKGTVGPANDTIILDASPPSRPNLIALSNNTYTNVQNPDLSWSTAIDTGPSGLTNYTILVDRAESFDSPDLKTFSVNSTSLYVSSTCFPSVWYWVAQSNDRAGNYNRSGIFVFIVDTNGPIVSELIPLSSNDFTNNKTPTFQWSGVSDPGTPSSGIANFTLQYCSDLNWTTAVTIAGIVQTSYSIPSSIPLGDGTWYWRVSAVDNAGNIGDWITAPGIFTVDTIPPDTPVVSYPLPANSVGDKPTFKWIIPADSGSGVDHYIIQIDTSPTFGSPNLYVNPNVQGTEFVRTEALGQGTWYWRIAAVDKAGNVGSFSNSISFSVTKPLDPMMVTIAGGGSGAAVFLLILGYYFVRRARIPFVIKKIDQSIKLIGKGEMPQLVPMRTRTQVINSIFETKLAIMSKEKLEEAEGKKKRVSKEVQLSPEMLAPKTMPKAAEAPAKAEAEKSDVELVAKELEKLEGKEEKSVDESELIKREIDELEKGSKKKKDESD